MTPELWRQVDDLYRAAVRDKSQCARTLPKPDLLNTMGFCVEGKAAPLKHWKHC